MAAPKKRVVKRKKQVQSNTITFGPYTTLANPYPGTKYYDVSVAGSMTATPSYNLLTGIPAGTSQSQRIGDVIYVKAISCRMEVTTANVDVFNLARLLVFKWIPNTLSLTPGVQSVLENTVSQGVQSHYNFEGRLDVRIFMDELMTFSGTGSAPTNISIRQKSFTMVFPGRGTQIQFNPAVTTGTCHLYTLVLSDSAITPYPELISWWRVYYTDL